MYRRKNRQQVEFESFHLSFGGRLRSDNRWVKLSKIIPWEEIEQRYAVQLNEERGAPALSARIALGSLIIKEKLGLSDEETVEQIRENPYLQYFLGYEAYHDEQPFDPSMMVHFRKRLGASVVNGINELVTAPHIDTDDENDECADDGEDHGDGGGARDSENRGQLKMDASCTPADIRYPTDLSILNEVREKTEEILDVLHRPDVGLKSKPRTYRTRARKDYLAVAKKRRAGRKAIRKAIGKQLRYVGRNLRSINELAGEPFDGRLVLLSRRAYRNLLVAHEVYRQQKQMYDQRSHSVSGRIVSVSQPQVRPIVRGKASAAVEFGAKISVSKVGRFAFLDRLSWDAYNESADLKPVVESYRQRYGRYPESVHVDAIYRTRENRRYCGERGIRISGPPLGRPKLNPTPEEKRQAREDERDRIEIEAVLGRGKRGFSLARVMAKRADTSETAIAIAFLVMNLETLLQILLRLLRHLRHWAVLMQRLLFVRVQDDFATVT